MARKFAKISYTPCRRGGKGKTRGKFVSMSLCRGGKKPRKPSKKKPPKTTGKYYRDSGGFCRKEGKKGFAKESACKRAGVRAGKGKKGGKGGKGGSRSRKVRMTAGGRGNGHD